MAGLTNVAAARIGVIGEQRGQLLHEARRMRRSRDGAIQKLGRQVTIDLQADADFDECRACPGHDSFSLIMRMAAVTTVLRTFGNMI
jgi:hypothetical protein